MSEQVRFEPGELLETHAVAEPLIAGGVRCHGGFDADGRYVSPRTRKRGPAILAWQARHRSQFGSELLDSPLDDWPGHWPNVAQAKFLLRKGIRQPMLVSLTRIGLIEGFGASIRDAAVTDLQKHFDEDLAGTATEHLTRGLFEAHARDEAGFEAEGGHRQMWWSARDEAFEHPPVGPIFEDIWRSMGLPAQTRVAEAQELQRRVAPVEPRVLDPDIPAELETMVVRMARLMLIEINAFHTFAWAYQVLRDRELVASEGRAAELVSYVRADETPHVEYLKTSLSEMRDRTFIGSSGRRHPGTEIVGTLWDTSLALFRTRTLNRDIERGLIEREIRKLPRGEDLVQEFHALGTLRPGPQGGWIENAPS